MMRLAPVAIASLTFLFGIAAAFAGTRDCSDCPDLVIVEAGSFMRGAETDDRAADESEFPRHEVRIEKPFAIATKLVTRREYSDFSAATGHGTAPGCDTLTDAGWRVDERADWRSPGFPQTESDPVVCISWTDATAYAAWMAGRTGQPYRLPSEAEWEYAARAGTIGVNFWGEDPALACSYANVNDLTAKNKTAKVAEPCTDGYLFTSPVASFQPNPFGLYDAVGNVWVWLADCWLGDYRTGPRNGQPNGSGECASRVLRGGSWTDTPGPFRIAARENRAPGERLSFAGLRLARDVR
ncbi:MAG: SUMF1/EgtB/PvdO family nonheme iron enzyme [Parvibaculum sp.]|uniref:formylglycine-generating enzyme family protein n=1 Tax=Parvibaculum sp. TaxID=2024848 RepID=UPI002ABC8B7A|nr:SUMF1/EgtB/PvdO family nonheme iron enzyme [Parvibaculum sp.]MDZ4381811.1 SUMF1/EgtB/PvdO family nonheme iron enzyme [Parvibaculum sp.]